ncbi:hypothetical protein TNCT_663341 [Trichonephila clavata]|uniref:Uncharacterized protein n=1 Tax=Trichonephila clavata TaxID=2740835 RepID=A0A8X6KU37_TRICU|nr:hypothetical protein TNCT_663341 [Trichonephila clavata]
MGGEDDLVHNEWACFHFHSDVSEFFSDFCGKSGWGSPVLERVATADAERSSSGEKQAGVETGCWPRAFFPFGKVIITIRTKGRKRLDVVSEKSVIGMRVERNEN